MRIVIEEPVIHRIFKLLATFAKGPGRIYVTGGVSAVLLGLRKSTIDLDLKLLPEPPGIFEAIRDVKESMKINIELASPDNFIPPLPGWEARSLYIVSYNNIDFFHYDFYAQALAKIERNHVRDVADVDAMIKHGLIDTKELLRLFISIEHLFIRYPAIDPKSFRERMETLI